MVRSILSSLLTKNRQKGFNTWQNQNQHSHHHHPKSQPAKASFKKKGPDQPQQKQKRNILLRETKKCQHFCKAYQVRKMEICHVNPLTLRKTEISHKGCVWHSLTDGSYCEGQEWHASCLDQNCSPSHAAYWWLSSGSIVERNAALSQNELSPHRLC